MRYLNRRHDPVRERVLSVIEQRMPPTDLKKASLAIGKNHAYLHQFINRGTPRILPQETRLRLAEYLEIDPDLLLPTKNAREEMSRGHDIRDEDASVILIPEIRVSAQAGGGAEIDREDVRASWYFPSEWLRHELRAQPSELRIITIEGDSMEPQLFAGDKVIVDLSRTEPSPPGVFILNDGFGLVAKRIEHIPNTNPPRVSIVSANAQYQSYERDVPDIRIIGRVVWVARRI